jgi:hypothetical protein
MASDERMAVVETKVKNLERWVEGLDSKIEKLQKAVWCGMGGLAVLQVLLFAYIEYTHK